MLDPVLLLVTLLLTVPLEDSETVELNVMLVLVLSVGVGVGLPVLLELLLKHMLLVDDTVMVIELDTVMLELTTLVPLSEEVTDCVDVALMEAP